METRLGSDELEVALLPEHGARLHRVRAFGMDVLRTPESVATHAVDPFNWGAYVMAPWCNRARPGPMDVAGRTVDLEANFPDGSAIHGQVHDVPWRDAGDGWLAVNGGGDTWPWAYEVRMHPTVDGPTLRLELQLTNRSDGSMPAGLGLHPWFVRPVQIGLAADGVYRTNVESAAEPEPVTGTRFDLSSPVEPPMDVDATWSSLRRPSIHLRWPQAKLEADLVVRTQAPACVAVAAPRDGDATAVEPQTHGPDGLRRIVLGEPDAPAMLHPGDTLTLSVELRVRQATA